MADWIASTCRRGAPMALALVVGIFVAVGGGVACGGDDESVTPDASSDIDAGDVAPDAASPDAEPPPDAFSCPADAFLGCADGDTAEFCSSDGSEVVEEPCEHGCDEDRDGCNACTPDTTACHGDDLVTCDESGGIEESFFCELGCDGEGDARCNTLEASNLPEDVCDEPVGQDFVVGQFDVRAIDTDDDPRCEVVAQGGSQVPEICVLRADEVEIASGGAVGVTGSRALALVAHSTATIDGAIDGSAVSIQSGPGTPTEFLGSGEDGGTGDETPAVNQGGGGGGHGEDGGHGASRESASGGGGGGSAFGIPAISPLRGGAPGGASGADGDRQALGGGGGGAIQIVACGERAIPSGEADAVPPALEVGGLAGIRVGGGGGEGGFGSSGDESPSGGGGGGSGGAILLEAPSIASAGSLSAKGGGAGGAGERGPGSEVGADGGPGEDALPGGDPAAGGAGADGGDGGAGSVGEGPSAGEPGADAGGGGGGAAGRIRINTAAGEDADLDETRIFPLPDDGDVATR